MDKKIENLEIYTKLGFVFISILAMSSLLYSKVEIFYKILTIGMILTSFVVFIKNYKKNIFDKKFILLIAILLLTQFITAVVNSKNLFGNIIEIAFMFTYCLIMAIFNEKTKEKIFKIISYMIQLFSFLLALFTIILLLIRKSFVFLISKDVIYYYGIFDNRIWSFINPNAASIFSYLSIFTALLLINKYRYKKFRSLKINIILQIICFSLQQSRGAILSVIFAIILYCMFITREQKLLKRLVKMIVYCSLLLSIIFSINTFAIIYSNTFDFEIVILDGNFNRINKNSIKKNSISFLEKKELKGRIVESTPSGRIYIWKNAIRMAKEKPIFGYGIRNVKENYSKFFNEYSIKNSLNTGDFHNIFITVLVSGGILNLISFLSIILYLTYRFLKYLIHGKNTYKKLFILIFFTMMLGQLFENTILYSTNFINIFFWFTCGYGLSLLNEKDDLKNKITSLDELKKMELEILDYVVEICNKLKLKYFLYYGTLLGAIRHKDFIQWDDDIDICMLRDDYEKLQDYLIKNNHQKFEVMSYKNNKNYVYPFMKVINKETHLLESDVFTDSNMGVYIDIFPMDGYKGDEKINKKMRNLIKKRQLSCYTFYGIYNANSILSTILRNLCVILFSLKDTKKYVEKIDKLAMSTKVSDSEFVDFVMLKEMKKPTIKREWFNDPVDCEFCGKTYKIPKEYDEILKAEYGDYMKLPPLEMQVTNHSFEVWRK